VLIAYDSNYDDVDLADYVPTSARAILREIAARCPSTSAAGPRPDGFVSLLELIAVSRDRPIIDIDFTTSPLAHRLAENVPLGPFPQPLFIGIGTCDEVVAPSIVDAYVDSLCASGQPLEYRTYPDKTHMGVLQDDDSALPADLEQWTRDRLNGLPPANTCTA
jgi:acetyl esterase/lipase